MHAMVRGTAAATSWLCGTRAIALRLLVPRSSAAVADTNNSTCCKLPVPHRLLFCRCCGPRAQQWPCVLMPCTSTSCCCAFRAASSVSPPHRRSHQPCTMHRRRPVLTAPFSPVAASLHVAVDSCLPRTRPAERLLLAVSRMRSVRVSSTRCPRGSSCCNWVQLPRLLPRRRLLLLLFSRYHISTITTTSSSRHPPIRADRTVIYSVHEQPTAYTTFCAHSRAVWCVRAAPRCASVFPFCDIFNAAGVHSHAFPFAFPSRLPSRPWSLVPVCHDNLVLFA